MSVHSISRALLIALLATSVLLLPGRHSNADELESLRNQIREELALSKLELRHYLQVEYPRQRRLLDAQIKLVKAEIDCCRRQTSLFNERSTSDRFSTGCNDRRLCQIEMQLRYQDLLAERRALARFHIEQWRLLELNVQQVRRRLVGLEEGSELSLRTATNPGDYN